MGIIQKIFGTRSEREVKKLMPLVTRIESMEDEMKALTDEQLREKTDEFRKRYQGGEDLDSLLPEATPHEQRYHPRRVIRIYHQSRLF